MSRLTWQAAIAARCPSAASRCREPSGIRRCVEPSLSRTGFSRGFLAAAEYRQNTALGMLRLRMPCKADDNRRAKKFRRPGKALPLALAAIVCAFSLGALLADDKDAPGGCVVGAEVPSFYLREVTGSR